jgi:hypothetical protein
VLSSERLLKIVAAEKGKQAEITTVVRPEAFMAIENSILLEEIDKLSKEEIPTPIEVDLIIIAQLPMSALAPLLTKTRVPVYNSGSTGFS